MRREGVERKDGGGKKGRGGKKWRDDVKKRGSKRKETTIEEAMIKLNDERKTEITERMRLRK